MSDAFICGVAGIKALPDTSRAARTQGQGSADGSRLFHETVDQMCCRWFRGLNSQFLTENTEIEINEDALQGGKIW